MADASLHALLDLLRERDVPYNREEFRSAYESPEGRAWLDEHISPETLLTKEEATLYALLSAKNFAN